MKNSFLIRVGKYVAAAAASLLVSSSMVSCGGGSDLFINQLEGDWQVTEFFYINNSETIYTNNHVITINKVNNTEIEIVNFTNVHAHTGPTNPVQNPGDRVRAEIDNDNKIMYIPANVVLNPTWSPSKETQLWPAMVQPFANNRNTPFPQQTFTENAEGKLQVRFSAGGLTLTNPNNQDLLPISCVVVSLNKDTGAFEGPIVLLADTVWTKL